MSFSSNASANAKRLISKYGDEVILIQRTTLVYDPSSGEEAGTDIMYPTKAQITQYSITEQRSEYVNVGDLLAIVYEPLLITKDWKVNYQQKNWDIISIQAVRSQDNTVIQKLQIRA